MNPETITLTLPYPVSANRYWATRIIHGKRGMPPIVSTYVTAEAKEYRREVQIAALLAGIRKPLKGRFHVSCFLYPHRPLDWKRRSKKDPDGWEDGIKCMDLGNCEKVMSDALQGVVIENDGSAWQILLCRMSPDEGGARMVVQVSPRTAAEKLDMNPLEKDCP